MRNPAPAGNPSPPSSCPPIQRSASLVGSVNPAQRLATASLSAAGSEAPAHSFISTAYPVDPPPLPTPPSAVRPHFGVRRFRSGDPPTMYERLLLTSHLPPSLVQRSTDSPFRRLCFSPVPPPHHHAKPYPATRRPSSSTRQTPHAVSSLNTSPHLPAMHHPRSIRPAGRLLAFLGCMLIAAPLFGHIIHGKDAGSQQLRAISSHPLCTGPSPAKLPARHAHARHSCGPADALRTRPCPHRRFGERQGRTSVSRVTLTRRSVSMGLHHQSLVVLEEDLLLTASLDDDPPDDSSWKMQDGRSRSNNSTPQVYMFVFPMQAPRQF